MKHIVEKPWVCPWCIRGLRITIVVKNERGGVLRDHDIQITGLPKPKPPHQFMFDVVKCVLLRLCGVWVSERVATECVPINMPTKRVQRAMGDQARQLEAAIRREVAGRDAARQQQAPQVAVAEASQVAVRT